MKDHRGIVDKARAGEGVKPRHRSWWTTFCEQSLAMTKKQLILRRRAIAVNALQVIQAAIFMFIIWVIAESILRSGLLSSAVRDNPNPSGKQGREKNVCLGEGGGIGSTKKRTA